MKKRQNLYFSGIAGSGMSALALFAKKQGHNVYGSDRIFDIVENHPFKEILHSIKIPIYSQDGSGLKEDTDLAIFSTAVEETNLDFMKARSLSIPIKTRPEYLADLVKQFDTIAIAGTSGKSTTSGMLAFLMKGLSLKPNFIGGGRVKQFGSKVNQGNFLCEKSKWLVIEACESDGSIVNYYPHTSLLLNLSLDHHSINETAKMFKRLISNTKSQVIINADDDNLGLLDIQDAITFSLQRPAKYRPDSFNCDDLQSSFIIDGLKFNLSIPGKHNILNALACIAVLSELGIPKESIAPILSSFKGIERRFDIHLNNKSGLVVDDYAHNPHKISSMMEVTSKLSDSVCYIFQPHGYGPTKLMKDGYIDVFARHLRDKDHLILLPIYYVGGSANKDISSDDIVSAIKSRGISSEIIQTRDEVISKTEIFKAFVIFGARDDTLSELARQIALRLSTMSK
ncbi:MAG: Mur ligase family protein [Thermodesulfovibrionales bacterium]|nr:Mur ligase family protein [Thermodesulfovibrionales bacterium]